MYTASVFGKASSQRLKFNIQERIPPSCQSEANGNPLKTKRNKQKHHLLLFQRKSSSLKQKLKPKGKEAP